MKPKLSHWESLTAPALFSNPVPHFANPSLIAFAFAGLATHTPTVLVLASPATPNSQICEIEHLGARFGKFDPRPATSTLSALIFVGPATLQLSGLPKRAPGCSLRQTRA